MDSFKNWAVSLGQVATPANTYLGECVSLIQQYLLRVYGIPFQARGHAKDWPTNADVLAHFDKVPTPQAGDIGISGATPTNDKGHIWVYLSPTQILEQNGRVSRRVSVGSSYLKPIAILRRKGVSQGGDNMSKVNSGDVINYYRSGWGREPSQDEVNKNVGKEWQDSPIYGDVLRQLDYLRNNQQGEFQKINEDLYRKK